MSQVTWVRVSTDNCIARTFLVKVPFLKDSFQRKSDGGVVAKRRRMPWRLKTLLLKVFPSLPIVKDSLQGNGVCGVVAKRHGMPWSFKINRKTSSMMKST